MKIKGLSCVLLSMSFFALFSCSKKNVDDKEITLVMAEVNPLETIAGQMDLAFKQKVEELSGGKIKIDLHCSGVLGDVDSIMTMIMNGGSSIHILRMSAQNMAPYGCNKTGLLSVPFTFSNKDHFWNFARSETAQTLLNEPVDKGLKVKGLFFAEEGFRHFFSTTKIKGCDDFAGLSVRGTNDDAMQGMIAALGANSVSVNFVDLYSAFKTGTVDVAEQPIANYLANHFHEVAPYMIMDGHTLGVMEPVITLEAWDSLSEKQRQILIEAGKYAADYCRTLSQSEEDRVRAQLEREGATITDVTDVKPWQDACADVIKKASASDPDFYKNILDFSK